MRSRNVRRGVAATLPAVVAALALMPVAHAATAAGSNAVVAAAQAPLTASEAAALSKNVDDKVIVVFKNQLSATPDTRSDEAARMISARTAQAGTVAELHETGATDIDQYQIIDALSATVSTGEAARLAADPSVAEVVKDLPIPVADSVPTASSVAQAAGAVTPIPGACEPSPKVQLDPEALTNIDAADQSGTGDTAQALGYTGAGVKVGFIADGLDIDNPDFIRADGKHVFVDYQDFSGTGTNAPTGGGEAFLDASSIAAQGRETYNLQSEGADLSKPCLVRVEGVAPGASLVGLNVFGSADLAFNSVFLEAINYAVNVDHVNVLNESFGSNPFPDAASLDLTREADDAAVAAGVTVTVSSGDAGPTDTIGSPATDPDVISAGASTTYRSYVQSGVGGGYYPAVKGYLDNNISGLSSGGFAQDGSTVDVVAPGDLNWALCTPDLKLYADCEGLTGKPASLQLTGGTSEAAPLTAGVAALVIQAYAKTHGGTDPTPAVVKQIIVSTAQNIQAPADQQGAGMIDAYQAVQAAASYQGATKPATGSSLLESATQLNAAGQPGASESFSDTLTNDGASSETVALSGRTLSPYTTVSARTLTLTAAGQDATIVKFTVPPGQSRLDVSVALKGVPNVTLLTPAGALAEYNLPQGDGHYGDAEVADPVAGTWTALLSATPDASPSIPLTVQFQASTATWDPFGTYSPTSLTLAPGASGSFTMTTTTPAQPGDEAGSIILGRALPTAGTADSTIPVTLRALVPTPDPSESFTGVLTGGNGRETDTGQSAYYQVTLPAGLPALNATVSTDNNANTFVAELIDPSTGEAASTASNSLQEEGATGTPIAAPEKGAQLHVLDPAAGTWTLIIDFYNTVSGRSISTPFTVDMNTTPTVVTAPDLPDSGTATLAAGTPTTVHVTVTNSGTTPEAYFADGRLDTSATLQLAPQTVARLDLPNLAGVIPEYLVPSHTTAITATTSSTAPLFFDYSWAFGDPDLISTTGRSATGTLTATDVADGIWSVTPFLVGPTGPTPAKTVVATTGITATTEAFDPAVTAGTGDLWQTSTDAAAGFTPYVVDPGQSATIPVTITPTAAPGSTVSGTLYIADSSLINGESTDNELAGSVAQASDVAALPYEYTVGQATGTATTTSGTAG